MLKPCARCRVVGQEFVVASKTSKTIAEFSKLWFQEMREGRTLLSNLEIPKGETVILGSALMENLYVTFEMREVED
jgi:hypothetical protein